METDTLLSLIQRSYRPEEYPALDHQIRLWQKERPLSGLRILDATPVFRNTLVKYQALQAAGARLSVGLSDCIACDPEIVDRIRANGIPVVAPSDRGRMAFDLILDCAGVFAEWVSTYGFVELTRSGVPRYAHSAKPVYIADSGRIKRIETMLGTGESYFRAMAQFGYTTWKDRRFVLFGSGKVGSGIALYAHRHGARISIVTEPESLQPAIRSLAEEIIDCRDSAAVGAAVRAAYAIVMATGHKEAFQQSCPAEAWQQSEALMANMGVEDEFGPELPPERVLNGKKTLNFTLEEPTHLKYIDATLALHNEGALYLATHPEARGLMAPGPETEERLLQISISKGIAGEEIALLLSNTTEQRESIRP